AEGEDHERDVPELEHSPPLLDHHRVEERRGGEPRHERRVLHRIPRPVAAPAEDVVAPPAADQEPEREEVPGDDRPAARQRDPRSEEHTSELQSRGHLVCRLLLEKKKTKKKKKYEANNHPLINNTRDVIHA